VLLRTRHPDVQAERKSEAEANAAIAKAVRFVGRWNANGYEKAILIKITLTFLSQGAMC
jgi:hypothetical protein